MSDILKKFQSMNNNLQTAAREMSKHEYAQLFRELDRIRSRAREARAMEHAERIKRMSTTERIATAKSLLPYRHVDSIIAATGLTRAEVEALRAAE